MGQLMEPRAVQVDMVRGTLVLADLRYF